MFQPWNMTFSKKAISWAAKWDPVDQQEVRIILEEYADVFAKDNLEGRG